MSINPFARPSVNIRLEYCCLADAGRARSNNEDAVLVDEQMALCVLADGMGGYNAGEIASDMAIKEVQGSIRRWAGLEARGHSDSDIQGALSSAAQSANLAVFSAAQDHAEYAGMGTTLVMALFGTDRFWVGHIGDSRAYRFRQGRLEQLSRDHSLLQEQIDAGLLTAEEAFYSSQRNLVTRAVGVEAHVDLEVRRHELRAGDLVLLCSDGLTDMLHDAQIAQVLRNTELSLTGVASALVAAANAAGGRDNISVVLARAKADPNAETHKPWWQFMRRSAA